MLEKVIRMTGMLEKVIHMTGMLEKVIHMTGMADKGVRHYPHNLQFLISSTHKHYSAPFVVAAASSSTSSNTDQPLTTKLIIKVV